jgi:hypothetical protein
MPGNTIAAPANACPGFWLYFFVNFSGSLALKCEKFLGLIFLTAAMLY